VDELGGRLAEPLGDAHRQAHVRQAGGPQVGQPAGRAADLIRQLLPGDTSLLTLLVEPGVELVQVPPQPAARSWIRQPHVTDVDDRTGEKVLRRPAEPAEHEQRVLARGRTARSQPGDRSAAEWVIRAPGVEVGRLLPQLISELVPAQPSITTAGVERCIERSEVENRQTSHTQQHITGLIPKFRRKFDATRIKRSHF
jgi:hypothetical protein